MTFCDILREMHLLPLANEDHMMYNTKKINYQLMATTKDFTTMGARGNDISGEQENCIYILAKKKENSPT